MYATLFKSSYLTSRNNYLRMLLCGNKGTQQQKVGSKSTKRPYHYWAFFAGRCPIILTDHKYVYLSIFIGHRQQGTTLSSEVQKNENDSAFCIPIPLMSYVYFGHWSLLLKANPYTHCEQITLWSGLTSLCFRLYTTLSHLYTAFNQDNSLKLLFSLHLICPVDATGNKWILTTVILRLIPAWSLIARVNCIYRYNPARTIPPDRNI